MSKAFNLSPFYFEEACARAGVSLETDASELTEKQKTSLAASLRSLFENPSPRVYLEQGKAAAFSPFELKKLEKLETQLFPSFSEALDFYFANAVAEVKENPLKKKLEFTLLQQEKAVGEMLSQAEEEKQAGDWIYANSQLVEELIALAKAKEKEKMAALAKKHGFKASLEGLNLVLE
jgi:predicted ribosome quality control (RQC) complex YloA/Tae2 family protein